MTGVRGAELARLLPADLGDTDHLGGHERTGVVVVSHFTAVSGYVEPQKFFRSGESLKHLSIFHYQGITLTFREDN